MLKEIVIAIQGYIKAHQFIREHRLWKWIWIPGIIYATVFVISIYYFGKTSNLFIEWLSLKTGLKAWLDTDKTGVLGFFFTLAGLILWLVQVLFYFSFFKYAWLIVGSPVFAFLSEKTESIITGREAAFSFQVLISDIFRGISIALRNALWQTVYFVAIFILALIPLLGWITPLMAVLLECFYYGFSMVDYSCKRRKMTMAGSIFFVNHHKGSAIGNGLVFYGMHLLPVIGWVLAPAYAVVAATLSMMDVLPTNESP